MIVIGDPAKSKWLNEEVKKSNLSLEAKSIINDLIAQDLNDYLKMAVPEDEQPSCYECGEKIACDARKKVIYEGTDFRCEPEDRQTALVHNFCN